MGQMVLETFDLKEIYFAANKSPTLNLNISKTKTPKDKKRENSNRAKWPLQEYMTI